MSAMLRPALGLWLLLSAGVAASLDHWLLALRELLHDCPSSTPEARPVEALAACARRRALAAIDCILDDERIPLVDGIELLKRERNRTIASPLSQLLSRVREGAGGSQAEEPDDWKGRARRLLDGHVIELDPGRLHWGEAESRGGGVESRGRRRRRRHMQMMPIIMMGVLLMGSVLIPMGFQFLAVLGGKALILAKMALMLSSIQGLKKIATNGVNYGLYHTPLQPEPWHERSTQQNVLELPSYAYLEPVRRSQHSMLGPPS